MPPPNLSEPAEPARRSVKDVPGRFVKHVMRLDRRTRLNGGIPRSYLGLAKHGKKVTAETYLWECHCVPPS
jgi:hypothetical protein